MSGKASADVFPEPRTVPLGSPELLRALIETSRSPGGGADSAAVNGDLVHAARHTSGERLRPVNVVVDLAGAAVRARVVLLVELRGSHSYPAGKY